MEGRGERLLHLIPSDEAADDVILEPTTSSEKASESRLTVLLRPNRLNTSMVVTVLLDNRLPHPEDWNDLPFGPSTNPASARLNDGTVRQWNMLMEQATFGTDEDGMDAILFRSRAERAKGHLCSAVWRGRPHVLAEEHRDAMHIRLDVPDNPPTPFGINPPFRGWMAPTPSSRAIHLPPRHGTRTEYLPAIDLPSPEMVVIMRTH